jgi:SAM-dependent methyltransferase
MKSTLTVTLECAMSIARPTSEEQVLAVYARDIQAHGRIDLQPPEVVFLRRLRGRWGELDMLDLGVGAGRTSHVFASITRSYLGVDISPVLIERARSVVDEEPGIVEFAVADARDLEALGQTFDVILFSNAGIDTLSAEDRARVLEQVRAVLRPGGRFAFSCKSLHALPLRSPLESLRGRPAHVRAFRTLLALPEARRVRRFNRSVDPRALLAAGEAMLDDGTHSGDIVMHWVRADRQVAQLESLGFEVLEVIDWSQRSVDPAAPGRDMALFYLCAPAG